MSMLYVPFDFINRARIKWITIHRHRAEQHSLVLSAQQEVIRDIYDIGLLLLNEPDHQRIIWAGAGACGGVE